MVELRILGPRRSLSRDETEVRSVLHQPKRLALLCYLATAAHGGFVRREELLTLFWPHSAEKQARSSLSEALSRLRQSLGPDVIRTRGNDEVGVAGDKLWCDAVAFVQAADEGRQEVAAELYHGDLLDGLPTVSDRFDGWLQTERERLRRVAIEIVSQLADRAVSEEDEAASQWTERAMTLAPLDDAAARRLMELEASRGHRASALDVFHAFRARLAAQGLEPTAQTVRLMTRIKAGQHETGPDLPIRLLRAMKRKRVYQTGIAYAVTALALAGGAEVTAQAFGWPEQMLRAVVTGLLAGLPIALLGAWLLELRIPDDAVLHPRRLSAGAMGLLTVGLAVLTATAVIGGDGSLPGEAAAVQGGEGIVAYAELSDEPVPASELDGLQPVPDPFLTLMVDFEDILGSTRGVADEIEGFITLVAENGATVGSGVALTEIDEGEGLECSVNRRVAILVDENPGVLGGTWLDGRDGLTLVLPCDPWAPDDRQPVLGEFLAYQAYSSFAEISLDARLTGVRLVNSEWVDSRASNTEFDSVTALAVVLESPRSLAERYRSELFDGRQVHPSRLSPHASALVDLFQYMIGNTQYSMPYLYNIEVLQHGEELTPVPNGFRYAGIIDPTTPTSPVLPIDAAGERHFRGFCRETGYDSALAAVRSARDSIYGLYMNQALLDARRGATALLFLNRLFDQVAVASEAEAFVARACRSIPVTGG